MRLPQPFYRLPVRFDAGRLLAELEALPESAWAVHPTGFEDNDSIRLISVNGAENDNLRGPMKPTPHLQACPYVRQVLASFGVVWSRSRFMRIGPHSTVPEHADTGYQWFNRVRMHIPVITWPEVRFHCGDQDVHMAAGEVWLFDNWRRHRVENRSDHARVHLVADTTGTAQFWQFVMQNAGAADKYLPYRPEIDPPLPTERAAPRPVMPPAEVELMINDVLSELTVSASTPDAAARLPKYVALLTGFCYDWRQLYAVYGESRAGIEGYSTLLERLRTTSLSLEHGLVMRTNQIAAHIVLESRVLAHALRPDEMPQPAARETPAGTPPREAPDGTPPAAQRAATAQSRVPLERPVFILAAPRSGSTLLFETLAVTPQFVTLGGEAHWLVESNIALKPGAPGVDSNRLDARHAMPSVAEGIDRMLAKRMVDADARPVALRPGMRWLEKTPKNALRVPFFDQLFPDALFVFLWRDPRENLSSIIEAWKAGRWITYPALEAWDGPWSMLLPPRWQDLRGRPLEEVAAAQWERTNRTVLDDLRALPRERWLSVRYEELVSDTRATIEAICRFVGIELDAALSARVEAELPPARHTLTRPERDKWRANEAAILRVLPQVEAVWAELEALPTIRPQSGIRIAR
jgi:LPS sulfotransferase NodH